MPPHHRIFILDCVLASPLPSCSLISRAVGLVDVCDFRNEGIIRIRVCQHGADRQEDFRDGQGRTPLVSEDIQADAAVRVDVWVVDPSGEANLGRLERVVAGEVDVEEENATGIGRITGAYDRCSPFEHLVLFILLVGVGTGLAGGLVVILVHELGTGGAGRRGVVLDVPPLLVDALQSHVDV